MIYEYALTPDFVIELLDNKTLMMNLLRELQHSDAVALSSYPSKLAENVFKKIDYNKQEATQIKLKKKWIDREKKADEFFQFIGYDTIKKAKRYNTEQDFEKEHGRLAFKKIFSPSLSFDSCENLLWLAGEKCTLFSHLHSTNVERSLNKLIPVLTPLLQNSNEITFVDPYFYVTPEYVDIYKKYFDIIASTIAIRSSTQRRKVIIICNSNVKRKASGSNSAPEKISEPAFKASCTNTYSSIVPTGIEISIYRAKEINQSIHDRFILTNIGGVTIGHGTAIDANSTGSHTEVSLLSRKSLNFWLKAYTPNSQYFDWSEPVITL